MNIYKIKASQVIKPPFTKGFDFFSLQENLTKIYKSEDLKNIINEFFSKNIFNRNLNDFVEVDLS
tara:strand:- start:5033 stop:5227 length:195 start_codon:yes stop_codon:yes gene_type:complete